MDLHTNHLPEDLGTGGLLHVEHAVARDLPHGFLLWVPADPDESSEAMNPPIPVVVLDIQRYARRYGCDYVLFDNSADLVEDLPVWEW
jgi:hypothetical protein